MGNNCACSAQNNLYVQYEMQSKSPINRKCIDGTITGCGNCVGYCQYREHPGFLTKEMRKEHDCINKQCYHYLPKPQRPKIEKPEKTATILLNLAKQAAGGMDDFRVINAYQTKSGWAIGYITVFGQQSFSNIEHAIAERVGGVHVVMKRIDYSFERCVELICKDN